MKEIKSSNDNSAWAASCRELLVEVSFLCLALFYRLDERGTQKYLELEFFYKFVHSAAG